MRFLKAGEGEVDGGEGVERLVVGCGDAAAEEVVERVSRRDTLTVLLSEVSELSSAWAIFCGTFPVARGEGEVGDSKANFWRLLLKVNRAETEFCDNV